MTAAFPQAPLDLQVGLQLRAAGTPPWTVTNDYGAAPDNIFTIATASVPLLLPGDQFQIRTSAGVLKQPDIFTIVTIGADFFGNTAVTFTPAAAAQLAVGDLVTQAGGIWTNITQYAYQRAGDSPPVTITHGRADESSQVNPATMTMELNNRDGRYTVRNPAGPYFGKLTRNTPVRASVPAQSSYLRLENDATSYASCPASSGIEITGDIDMRIDIRPTTYLPSVLAVRYDGGNWSWVWLLLGTGQMQWWWQDAGTNSHYVASTVPIPVGRIALRATLALATGTITFYTAPSISGSWTQLGAPVVSGATSLTGGTSPIQIGYSAAYASAYGYQSLQGRVLGFQLLSGIGGTLKASPDFTAQTPGSTSFADAQGNTWTLNDTAEISGRDYRFHGEMSSLPVTWDNTGKDVWVPAQAGGLLRRLGQGNDPVDSAIKRALLARTGTLAVHQYWPCEDLQGSTAIGSAVSGPLMNLAGGTGDGQVTTSGPAFAASSAFLCSAALPTLNGSTWYGQVPRYTSNGNLVLRFLLKLGTVQAQTLIRIITSGTCQEFSLQVTAAGFFQLVGNTVGGTNLFTTVAITSPAGGSYSGQQQWVSMELTPGTGSTINVALITLQPGGASAFGTTYATFSGVIGNAQAIYVNPAGGFTDTVAGHFSVQSGWETMYNLQQPLNAWQGELAANRFARLCSENGIAARIYGPPSSTAAMGAQAPQTLTQLLQEIEDADRGQIFEPRQVLGLGYRPQAALYNQAAAVTIDYSQAQLGGGADELKPTYDDQFTRNDITVQRASGNVSGASYRYILNDGSPMSISAPPAGVGDYNDSKTVNVQADTQLPDEASWMVHVGTVNEARWPALPVNMARAAVAGIYWAVLGADIGDYAAVINPPGQLPPDPVKQLIWGSREELGGFHYMILWNCVPESPYETGIFDDPVYGRADTDGSTLNAAIGTTDTTMQVATTDPTTPLWTTAAADFPFDVAIDGERITVTNITGASSPQAFTITRSVNGVVRAHLAGADVRLWFPPVYAMF